jgi:hypothetical protein
MRRPRVRQFTAVDSAVRAMFFEHSTRIFDLPFQYFDFL